MTTAESPEGVTIRRATRGDLFDVGRIESEVFPQPWPLDAFQRFLGEPGFLVAETDRDQAVDPGLDAAAGRREDGGTEPSDGRRVVGYVVADVVRSHGIRIGHVKDIAVAPEFRRRGIATALLDEALSAVSGRGIGRVKLEVRETNEPAHELYERFGFRLRRRLPGYYADDEDALVFEAELDG